MNQRTSITFKAPSQFPTAGQQGHFHKGRVGALTAAASEASPSSALHSGVAVRGTTGEMERHELFRTKLIPTSGSKQQEGTEWVNYNTHTCPGI